MNILEQLMFVWSLIVPHEECQETPSVIVVGGGVAGLNAASKLHSAGYDVTLLEAMDRIGGRTHTKRLANGEYVEMGGEWIMGEGGNDLFNLAYPLGLVDKNAEQPDLFKYQLTLPSGELLNSSVAEKFHTFFGIVGEDVYGWKKDANASNVGDWARYALQKFHEESVLHPNATIREAAYDWAHRTFITDAAVRSWFSVSSKDEGEVWTPIEGNQIVTWKPPYSYSSLHQLLLTGNVTEDGNFQLPEWIRLNEEVISVQYSDSSEKVSVVTRGGSRLTADHVIYTPSLGVLKATHTSVFSPNLSLEKQRAIDSLGFGCITKIYMRFDKPWWSQNYGGTFLVWDDVDYTNPSIQWWRDSISTEELLAEDSKGVPVWARSITAIHAIHSGSAPSVFRAWLSGISSEILDDLEPSYVQEKVMLVVHKFLDSSFPGKISEPTEIFWTKWYSNPFTRGAYSSRSPAADINDAWASDLATPILKSDNGKPLVCFAGEATNPTHHATVHGAYETGSREFERIVSYYDNLKKVAN